MRQCVFALFLFKLWRYLYEDVENLARNNQQWCLLWMFFHSITQYMNVAIKTPLLNYN